jgi:signal peptidase
MKKTASKGKHCLSLLFTVTTVCFFVFSIVFSVLLFTGNLVLSVSIGDSMTPTIQSNSFNVLWKQNAYAVGDVIAFKTQSYPVLHRIVEACPDGYITKGDANNVVDPWLVSKQDVIGKLIFSVPYLGLFFSYSSYVSTFFIVLSLSLLFVWVRNLRRKPVVCDNISCK